MTAKSRSGKIRQSGWDFVQFWPFSAGVDIHRGVADKLIFLGKKSWRNQLEPTNRFIYQVVAFSANSTVLLWSTDLFWMLMVSFSVYRQYLFGKPWFFFRALLSFRARVWLCLRAKFTTSIRHAWVMLKALHWLFHLYDKDALKPTLLDLKKFLLPLWI